MSVEFSSRHLRSSLRDASDRGGLPALLTRLLVLILALLIGAWVGVLTIGCFKILGWIGSLWTPQLPTELVAVEWQYSAALGMTLLVSALLAGQLLQAIEGGRPQGPADLIHAAQHDRDPSGRNGVLSSLLGIVSVTGGSTTGIFGPLALLGGLITGFFGRLWHNGVPRDVWLGAGASAAVAAVFAAPLGAALFAQEAISRRFSAYGFAPALACALGAYWVMDTLQGGGPLFTVAAAPALDMDTALIALVVGVVCGLVMSLHILMSAASPMLGKLSGIPLSLRPLLPAVVLFLISPLLPHMLGSGFATLALVFEGGLSLELLVWLIIAKLLLTSLCIGFGFLGDDVIPAMLIGAMLGAAVATMLVNAGLSAVAPYAILGAAASLAAVIGAPMAAIVIVLEMTGSYSWAVLAAISVLVATQISRALAARSSFDRQLEMRGVMVNDDHRPRSTWVR